MDDQWVSQLLHLNNRLQDEISDVRLGDRTFRRALLQQHVGPIRPLQRLAGAALENVLRGKPLVGVDGTINSFGGGFPHYIDLLRAVAKPTQGAALVLKELHCPLPAEAAGEEEEVQRQDQAVRQQKLADLEVRAARQACDRFEPAVVLMDGPLVRFDMRTKESFTDLYDKVTRENIVLAGCIESVESKVIASVLGDRAPAGWQNRYDRDLLWGTLEYGEVLEVSSPAKGTGSKDGEDAGKAIPIRTWFMRSARDPGVVGVDMLEAQATDMRWLVDYLYTLSPADGRGIPIWLDLVDREVRLTQAELDAYLGLLDPQLRRLFITKREARFF